MLLYVLLPAAEVRLPPDERERDLLRDRVAALLAPYDEALEVDEHDELCACTLDPQVALVDRLISLGTALQVYAAPLRALRRERAALAAGPRRLADRRCPACSGAGSYRSVRNPRGRWALWRLSDTPPWPIAAQTMVTRRPDAVLVQDGNWCEPDDRVLTELLGLSLDRVAVAVDYHI